MVASIGLASGLGAGNSDCGVGPLDLQKRLKMGLDWQGMIVPKFFEKQNIELIASCVASLAQLSYSLTKEGRFFLSIGGDHSCAIGTWSGAACALRDQGDLGLLWIDAHIDSHTFETSESGNIHGMPLAALLGYGDSRLTSIGDSLPKIKPENLALIGIRSFEEGELRLLQKLGVRIYFIEEVLERGVETVIREARELVSKHTVGYGVSFDLDSIDPTHIFAVGTPVEGGIDPEELLDALSIFQEFPPLAFELAEYNPSLDKGDLSFDFIQKLLHGVVRDSQRVCV